MGWQAVVSGERRWSCEASDCLEWLRALPDRTVSLVFFSPPYESQRTYGVGCKLKGQGWVDWMRPIIVEAARVSNGLVVVNAAGPVKDRMYSPSMEWLVADLTRQDGLVCGPAPWCWWKVSGTPGSGGSGEDRYQRRDWEPLYSFAFRDRLPLAWTDETAFGLPPIYGAGGEFSNRNRQGLRRLKRQAGGGPNGEDTAKIEHYIPPPISNPGNVIKARVGNHMGHALASKNEACMALGVAERFVCWYAPENGIVLDPFSGSGTTCHAAILHNRRFIGADLRQSQVDLCARRMKSVTPNLIGA